MGRDAVTVLTWLAATTTTIKIGTAIMQIPGRTPANTAMTAATLDLMSGGRFLLGLGTSGPQVVEGWHGQAWGKPITKTREYVEIVRTALRREALEFHGDQYDIRTPGRARARQAAEAARPATARLDSDLPRSARPEERRSTFEIADGWLPIYWSPERAREHSGTSAREGFDIAPSVNVVVSDDLEAARDSVKEYYSLYIGGMGARGTNFYNALFRGTGTRPKRANPGAVSRRQSAGSGGKVSDELVDEVSLVGSVSGSRPPRAAWRDRVRRRCSSPRAT